MGMHKLKITCIDVVSEINLTLKIHRVRVIVVSIKRECLHVYILNQNETKKKFLEIK